MQAPNRPDRVLALHAAGTGDVGRVGTKAATLGLLVRAGLAVPEALVLTTEASADLLACAGLGTDATVAQVLAAPVPDELEATLAAIAEHFGGAALAVRSSAVDEDLADASFAGQYDSVLHVHGLDELRTAAKRCWASAHSERARAYRRAHGNAAPSPVAVLVQRQVDADVAGVAFTVNPVSGATDEVLVSAVPGLGDTLVSGEQVPDEWVVTGATATALRVTHQALAEQQARTVAALALRVQQVLGGAPQDVEWAMAGGRLVVLQARPITALPRPPVIDLPPGTWVKETDRHPEPLTALGASVACPLVARGLTDMFATYGGLLEQMQARSVGGELYMRSVSPGGRAGPPPPWWVLAILSRIASPLRRRVRAATNAMRPGVLAGIAARWEGEWRPELQREHARLRAVDLGALDDRALVAQLDAVSAGAARAMQVHFLLIPSYLVPVHALVVCCAELLGWSETDALNLLAGASGSTSDPERALAGLAADIARRPDARAVLDDVGRADGGGELAGRLAWIEPELGARFTGWCELYGCRNVNDDPGSPLLTEQPWLIAGLLRDAVRSCADGSSATRGSDAAVIVRERARRRARAALTPRPAQDSERFERTLAAAIAVYPQRDDVAFWTGSVFGGLCRLAALEAGRRLVERGVLGRPDDAVHLELDTLRAALDGASDIDVRATATRARAEREWARRHPGPPFHGPPPTQFPDLRGLPRDARRLNEALLWMQRGPVPPEVDQMSGSAVVGVPGSPGRYTGPVRVIRGEADFATLRPGEVLVCPTTDPAWSVLFGIAGALVTDGGGVLSHAAIVAREYAIPAVVGTGTATGTLRDGQLVTVDGVTGQVRSAEST